MSWSITCLDNTVEISPECAADLAELNDIEGAYYGLTPHVQFNDDAMEHMDFLWREDVQSVLAQHKANGRVTFGSFDGDNRGSFWGYEWTNGVMSKLNGTVVFQVST